MMKVTSNNNNQKRIVYHKNNNNNNMIIKRINRQMLKNLNLKKINKYFNNK